MNRSSTRPMVRGAQPGAGADVEIIAERTDLGIRYIVIHDFDLDMFSELPCTGPYEHRAAAEQAADALRNLISCPCD